MGGRPSPQISDDDIAFIVMTATTRPVVVGAPFTQWSGRKLAVHLLCRRMDRNVAIDGKAVGRIRRTEQPQNPPRRARRIAFTSPEKPDQIARRRAKGACGLTPANL